MVCAFVSGCGCGCVSVCTGLLWYVGVCKWVRVWVCICVHRALMVCAFVSGCRCGCVAVCTGLL